jgi:hypothetical protein
MIEFINLLKKVNYPSPNQKNKELWDIEGIIKDKSNQSFKFDLRPLKNNVKGGSFNTKADKMVFDMKDQFIVVDTEELHQYLKENKLKEVHLQDLISKLEWNIILPK